MSRKWWPGISTPPGITSRSGSSWRQALLTARTPARTGPGQDSPGHHCLLCAWIMYWFPGLPPCRWLVPCECPAPTITVSWSTSSSHSKPDRQTGAWPGLRRRYADDRYMSRNTRIPCKFSITSICDTSVKETQTGHVAAEVSHNSYCDDRFIR